MTVGDLSEKMDAQELMEWMAYFSLDDEKEVERLKLDIAKEQSDEYHNNQMMSFLKMLKPSKK